MKRYIITGSVDKCSDVVSIDDLSDIELQTILKVPMKQIFLLHYVKELLELYSVYKKKG